MCTITATEFKTNFGKYLKIAQKEPIIVTHHGSIVFSTVPRNKTLKERFHEFVGKLPKDIDLDNIDRE